MPKPTNSIQSQGTNAQGNNYTNYTNGAYSYANNNADGQRTSGYYDTGKGSGFYSKNNTAEAPGYRFYENHNTGDRHYFENKGGSGSGSAKK